MTPKNYPQKTPVKISWIDSSSVGGWHDGKKLAPAHVATIGFVVDNSREHISITSSMALDCRSWAMDPLTIPWGCIQSIARLRANAR